MLAAVSSTTARLLPAAAAAAPARFFASRWAQVEMGPKDPILGVTENFLADQDPSKINLGVGAYRTDEGLPWPLPSVVKAERRVVDAGLDMEYAPIGGDPAFVRLALDLAYGSECTALRENRVAGLQSLSGTGALRLAGAFIRRFQPHVKTVYVSNPTWGNHFPIFKDAGFETATYRYYDPATKGLDLSGMLEDIRGAKEPSVFVLHAVAHNPTGVDPTAEDWTHISKAIKEEGHMIVLDSAYQGFASGDVIKDATALRTLLADGHDLALCQSFAKNFGLYGHRVGTVSFVTESEEEMKRVESQLKILARAIYSSPPIHGARIVKTVLSDAELREEWFADVQTMAGRIQTMRHRLYEGLQAAGSQLEWKHLIEQNGMFCYSGMTAEHVAKLAADHHIYLTSNGRISMAGVTDKDIEYLSNAIHSVTKE